MISIAYFNDKLVLISDSLENINLFRLDRGNIAKHYFDNKIQAMNKEIITEDAFLEYDISIDEEDNIYLIYQNISFDLILVRLEDEKVETIRLTEEPISEVYYLNLITRDKEFHIFYSILLQEEERKYRIYHHYFNGTNWITNIVDEIKVEKLLNPFRIVKGEKELIVAYYDKIEQEQIYMKSFNLYEKEWGEKVKLTEGESSKLYVDILLMEDKINLVYSQYYEGNLIIKYERFNYRDGEIDKEKEEILSNPEDAQEPILIYYEEKLWVVWLEYENILSRYSDDYGTTWSSIYLWDESKDKDIVKYSFHRASLIDKNILNYSFGKIHPDIKFLGFGSLDNTTEIPLKKNLFNIPRI